jgi:hypothetical protein
MAGFDQPRHKIGADVAGATDDNNAHNASYGTGIL